MATLNELGRNSASLTYGPSAAGADNWPMFALLDQWLTNDTLQGTATASSTTVTGVGTIFTTQARAGDNIMIANQLRTVQSVTSDTVLVVTSAFSPTITLQSAIKVIDRAINGTVSITVVGTTTGVVSVTAGSSTIVGVGTSFLAETTNTGSNGVAGRTITVNGQVRTITNIANDTTITVDSAFAFTDSNLKLKVWPRGTLTITAGSASVTGTGTFLTTDITGGAQVWIGDELRTFTASGATAATLTAATGGTVINMTQAYTGLANFHIDESYLTGAGTSFTTDLRVGEDIIINGTEATVTQIISDTLVRINIDYPSTLSGATVYRKKKIHGFVHEGTREGSATGGKFTQATTSLLAAGSQYKAGSSTVTVASATGFAQYQFIKITGAGGAPLLLTGTATASTNTVTGTNTLFTTQLHIGAEFVLAGQFLTVTAIASDVSLTVSQTVTVATASPIYRTFPLYTYIAAIAGPIITLGQPVKNTIYSTGANPPAVYTPSVAGDFLEYVYSAPNKSAESTTTLLNTSIDRKYFGFRFFPLQQGQGGSGTTLGTAAGAYNMTVYERWTASYGQTHGVGINIAQLSDSIAAVSACLDLTLTSHTTGGFLYLFAKPRYVIIQGKTFSNVQLPWVGCVEFERAQPEDSGTGLGTTSGITFTASPPITVTPAISPWPAFAYLHGNRFPVGATQNTTAPIAHTAVHGSVLSTPRLRLSTGDLVGINAHTYSAMTITTGRWGHLFELGGGGSYTTAGTVGGGILTGASSTIFQPHMGHMVPVYTNVYNSKRFMFSPVVVLGTAYDPDIRGRLYGLKVIPSALGTLMDTVSVTIDSNDFYDNTQSAADHWVITSSTATFRTSLAGTNFQSTRSLEDSTTIAANQNTTFQNSFRWAIPA